MNCQERSREDLLETLTITLSEALEFNSRAARAAAGEGYTLEKVVAPPATRFYGLRTQPAVDDA